MIALFAGGTSLVAALWEMGKGWLEFEDQGETDLIALQIYQSRRPIDEIDVRRDLERLVRE